LNVAAFFACILHLHQRLFGGEDPVSQIVDLHI
jgi:hypothetical protein